MTTRAGIWHHRQVIFGACVWIGLGFSGCGRSIDGDSPQTPLPPTRAEVADELPPRIGFLEIENSLTQSDYRDGHESGTYAMPETTGGGLAIVDFDRDGELDVIAAGGGFVNTDSNSMTGWPGSLHRGQGGFRFHECRSTARIDFSSSYNSAVLSADWNDDGFADVLVTGYSKLQLFRNMGDGTFEQCPAFDEDAHWSSGGAFADIDQDGDLDLYVVRYLDWSFENHPYCPSRYDPNVQDYCGPTDFHGLRDSLYLNQGDGSWTDNSDAIEQGLGHRGLGVLAADLDGDRDVDIYVANDVEPNTLFRNDGDGRLTEIGQRAGVACNDSGKAEGSMGIAIGNYNLDGRFDLFVSNYEHEVCALYRNNGAMIFTYGSNSARIAATDNRGVGWGTAFVDVDWDGDEDLLLVNGHLERHSKDLMQRPQCLENIDGKYFRIAAEDSAYFRTPQAGRGLAVADLDHDGRVDFCVTRINANCAMVRNESHTSRGHFLAIRLAGTRSNRDAIGATIELRAGQRTWYRHVYGGGSYASTSDRCAYFGVPYDAEQSAATLIVHWPSGLDQEFAPLAWDREWTIVEGSSHPFSRAR